jgi:hypothetical protein
MNEEQVRVASAYTELAKSPHAVTVLDDLQTAIRGLPVEQQAGAWALYGHVQLRASAIRRDRARGSVKPAAR